MMKQNKKRWISVLLVLCMVLSLLPATVGAAEENCDGTHDGWQQLSGSMTLNSLSGNYCLTGDVNITGSSQGNIEIKSDVTLCLNGYQLRLNDNTFRIYKGGNLTLCDCRTSGKITGTGICAVYMEDGSFTMNGGSFTGNYCAVQMVGGSFTMNGGSITGNNGSTVDLINPCSGVLVTGGSFTMTGGEITNNTTNGFQLSSSGGVLVTGGSFTMTGGKIANNRGAAKVVYATAGGVCLYPITGAVSFTVSGDATILGNTVDNVSKNVYLGNNQKINIGGPMSGGSIGVTLTRDNTDTFTTGGGASYQRCFFSDDDRYNVLTADGELMLGTQPHTHPICGDASCSDAHGSAEYQSISSLGGTLAPGSYSLKHTVTATDHIVISGDVNLCLNGQTLDLNGKHIEVAGGTLTLCDCGTSGKITGSTIQYANSEGCGGVYVHSGGTLNMYGGTITGNHVYAGGGVYVTGGTFNMTGGAITGNSAEFGNGVYVGSGATFNMSGSASITDNTADARDYYGGVYVTGGIFNMSGGTISGNSAGLAGGGGVYVNNNGSFTMTGGTITGNSADMYGGGGVYVTRGTFAVSGNVKVTGNTANGHADNVYLGADQIITIISPLTGDAQIGVTMENPGVFTGSGAAAYAGFFSPDDNTYSVMTDGTGALKLAQAVHVTFNSDGGTSIPSQTLAPGDKVADPGAPSKDGCIFVGWYTDSGSLWNFEEDTVSDAMTLTAKWLVTPKITKGSDLNATYGTGGTISVTVKQEKDHTYTYQWQIRETDGSWADVPNATDRSYPILADTSAGSAVYQCVVTATVDGSSQTADAASGAITVTISPKGFQNGGVTIENIPKQDFTGKAIEPKPVIQDGSKLLEEGVDYDLDYADNTEVGTGRVLVSFKGNYSGSTTVPFYIGYAPLPDGTTLEDYVTIPDANSNGWYQEDIVLNPASGNITIGTTDTATGGVTIRDEGSGTQVVYIKDGDHIYKAEFDYNLDKTAPTVEDLDEPGANAPWTAGDVTVRVDVSDGAGSGVDKVTVQDPNGVVTTIDPESSGRYPFTATENGDYIVTITDAAGNETEKTVRIQNIDKNKPVLTVTGGMESGAELNLTVTGTSAGTSGVTVTVENPDGTSDKVSGSYPITKAGTYTFTATTGAGLTDELTVQIYSITFESGVAPQLVRAGGKVIQPAENPTKAGYTFACWMDGDSAWNFNDPVNTDLVFTASWNLDKPVVELKADQDQTTYGTNITLTATIDREISGITYTYQWLKNGEPLSHIEDTTTVLILKNVQDSGTYTVQVTATDGSQSETAEDSVQVSIRKAPVEIPAADTTPFIYNGNMQTYSIAPSDLYTVTGNVQKSADSYTVTVSLNDTDNYVWADGSTADRTYDFVIAPKEISAVWSGLSQIYGDGKTVQAALSGVEGPDDVTAVVSGVETDAGTYPLTAELMGSDAGNYVLTNGTATLEVKKATPTVATLPTASAIVYGQSLEDSTLSGGSATSGGAVPGRFDWETPGTYPTVADSGETAYAVVFTPSDTDNYNTVRVQITLTVGKATLYPEIESIDGKVYDGKTDATGIISLSGQVLGDAPTADATFNFTDQNAGTDIPVDVTITLDEEWTHNYVLSTGTLQGSADITAKTIALKWQGYEGLVYDGQPVNVTATAVGLVKDDTCTVIVTGGKETNADTYTATATGLSNANYQLPSTGTEQAYTIDPLPVVLIWSESQFTFDNTVKTVTAEIDNLVSGDTYMLTYKDNEKTAAGNYVAEVIGLGNSNYTLEGAKNKTLSWSIGQQPVQIPAADDTAFVYNGNMQTYFIAQNDLYTVTDNVQKNAGTYTVTVSLNDADNYAWSDGSTADKTYAFVIAPKRVTATWRNLNQVYGDGQQVTLYIDDLESGDSADHAVITGLATTAGRHTLTATLENYEITNATATLVIQPKPVTITVTDNAVSSGGKPTINAPGLTDADYEIVYKYKNGRVTTDPTAPGEYEVWVQITNPNFCHPDGSSEKLVGSMTITSGIPRLYTVTFDGNGASGSMAALELAGGGILVLPDCTFEREGYQFSGWTYDGKTYRAGEKLAMPNSDIRLRASWTQAVTISGTVQDENGNAVENAAVSIWQGSSKLDESPSGADGGYTFEDLAPGSYNVCVTVGDRTVTTTVTVDKDGVVTGGTVTLPAQDLNTKVEIVTGSPDIVVDGLDGVFTDADQAVAETGGKVEAVVTIEQKQESALTDDEAEQLKELDGKPGMYLDIALDKTTTSTAGSTATETGAASDGLLTVIIPLPAHLQDKYAYSVVYTDGDTSKSLSTTPDRKTGAYYELSADGTSLILHVKESATYAIGYLNVPSKPTYPPALNETENGSVTIRPSRPTAGQEVTITAAPEPGFQVDRVTVVNQNGREVAVTPNADGTYTFIQPTGSVTVTVTFREITSVSDCPRDERCPLAAFTDADANAWYHDGVHYCVAEGLMTGYGNGIFGPNNDLSRGMLVQILYNRENCPAISGQSAFEDVADGDWYADAVNWAASLGIVEGYSDARYGPNDPVTREQLAAILYRYAQYKGYDVHVGEETNLLSYTDAWEISEYAIPAMQWACGAGIITGVTDSTLVPTGTATRAQVATMLMRFAEKVAQ